MDPSSVLDTIGVGSILFAVMQMIKVWLETWLKQTDPKHDPTIRVLAGVLGTAAYVGHAWSLAPMTGQLFWNAAGQGFVAGLTAVATYHVADAVTSSQGGRTQQADRSSPPQQTTTGAGVP